ncbi:hypothetical protein C0Q70_16285 [Pomacea canaliculata]|uniref:Uncharacterized protein n=1 Tax=Pomacea canaliculata TaxID=400727 RepID=A0A2T7NPC5_POMCA|nr:hypothetical protein C0Q70_16285 [Pomacea canaliculata]
MSRSSTHGVLDLQGNALADGTARRRDTQRVNTCNNGGSLDSTHPPRVRNDGVHVQEIQEDGNTTAPEKAHGQKSKKSSVCVVVGGGGGSVGGEACKM